MSRPLARSTVPSFVVVVLGCCCLARAGDLNPPPGPVQPTMKTIAETEPRVAVNQLPGTGLARHRIDQPGAYYLIADIVSTQPGEIGILVDSSNVSIDLLGFNLVGAGGGTGDGIQVTSGRTHVTIRNGRIIAWGGYGVNASGASRVVVEQVQVAENEGGGIHIGDHASVANCFAWFNASGPGFRVSGNRARVDGNMSQGNNLGFLVTGSSNLLVRNVAQINSSGDYNITPQNNYGQILSEPGAGFVSSNAWANFAACPIGQMNCNGQCVDTQTDPNHCGACNTPCIAPPNATVNCVNGICQFICNPGFADCNGNPGDGCEVNTQTDPNHCGGCNQPCTAQSPSTCGTTGACVAGQCQLFAAGTPCSAPSCTAGVFHPASQCNGNGTCVTSNVPCHPYQCNGAGNNCLTTCTGDFECAAGYYCDGSQCVLKKPPGFPCNGNNECQSGVCAGGFCQ